MAKVFKVEHKHDSDCVGETEETAIETMLNDADTDGWRLIHVVPHNSKVNMVMFIWDKGV